MKNTRRMLLQLTALTGPDVVKIFRDRSFDYGFNEVVAITIERAGLHFGKARRKTIRCAVRSGKMSYDDMLDFLCGAMKRQIKRQIRKRSSGA